MEYVRFRLNSVALAVSAVVFLAGCVSGQQPASDSPSGQPTSTSSWLTVPLDSRHGSLKIAEASDISWSGQFGSDRADPDILYKLTAQGYFDLETPEKLEVRIREWIGRHPDSRVVPVLDYGQAPDGGRSLWVWFIDGQDCMNLDLVRGGVFPAAAMRAPEELSLLVSRAAYDDFVKESVRLERLARDKGVGIWKR